MPSKIKVRIRARQTVFYDQVVEMTKQQWKELKAEKDNRRRTDSVAGWLDLHNIDDAHDIDDEDLEAEVVDDDGKALKPVDSLP